MFRIAPVDALIKVDGKRYQSLQTYDFDPGTYTVQAWKPTHELVTLSFEVLAGDTTYVTFGLRKDKAYRNYTFKKVLYQSTKITLHGLVPLAYGATLIQNWRSVQSASDKADRTHDLVLVAKDKHAALVYPDEIIAAEQEYAVLKNVYQEQVDDFYKTRRNAIVFTALGGVAVAGLQILALNIPKPEYFEDVKLSFAPVFDDAGTYCSFSLSIPVR